MAPRPRSSAPRASGGWVRRLPPPARLAETPGGAPVLAVLVGSDGSGRPTLARAAAQAVVAAELDPDRVLARSRAKSASGEAVAIPLLQDG